MAQASFGYFGIGHEAVASPGTDVAPSLFLPVEDVNFQIENEFIEVVEIGGSRQRRQTFDGPIRPNGNFTAPFYPGGALGLVLKGLFGAVNTTAAQSSVTAKTHTFVDAPVLPSLSWERSDSEIDGSGILHQRVNGCKIESFGVTANYGEHVQVAVSAQGLDFPEDPGSKPGVIAHPTMEPFIFTDSTVFVDGVQSNLFKSVDFEITNTLERQEALRGERTAYKIFEGGMMATLSGTLIFEDNSLYTKLQNSTSFAVKIVFEGAQIASDGPGAVNYKAEFTFPKVKVSTFDINMAAGEVMSADVEFQVSYDLSTEKTVDVKLTNLDAATVYAAPA